MDDLDNVDGFGPKTIAKIKNDVLLSDAAVVDQKADKKVDEKTDKKTEEKAK